MRCANSKEITTSLTDEEGGEVAHLPKQRPDPMDQIGMRMVNSLLTAERANRLFEPISGQKGEASELICPLIMKSGAMVKIDDF
jgi:hypothetical protein